MSDGYLSEGKCPLCESDDLDYDGFKIDNLAENSEGYFKYICENCLFVGREYYSLKYIETIEED